MRGDVLAIKTSMQAEKETQLLDLAKVHMSNMEFELQKEHQILIGFLSYLKNFSNKSSEFQ